MTTDLALTAATIAAGWPYCLIGRTVRLQTGYTFAVTGEVVAIHAPGNSPAPLLCFVRTPGKGLAVVPLDSVLHFWFDADTAPFERS